MTIDKNNIFLGATVKNDDAKVIISRIVAGGAVQIDGRLREGTYFFHFFFENFKPQKTPGICKSQTGFMRQTRY